MLVATKSTSYSLVENGLSVLSFSPGHFWARTKDRISLDWSNQSGLKSPAQRLETQLLFTQIHGC